MPRLDLVVCGSVCVNRQGARIGKGGGYSDRLDLIVTPDEVIRCPSSGRPPGILWHHLDSEKIDAVPALKVRRARR